MKSPSTPLLLVFDLDDTLAESKQAIPDEMAHVLATLLTHVPLAIISGGAFPQFKKQVIEKMPRTARLDRLYILPTSGAALYTYQAGNWAALYEERMKPEDAERITAVLESAVTETGVIDSESKTYGPRIENRGAQITLSALGQQAPPAVKHSWDPTHTKREALRAYAHERLEGFDVKIGGATSIDVTLHGINKAYGVRKLSEKTSIPIERMRYYGDALMPGGNDEVVKESGIETVSVKNAKDTLLKLQVYIQQCYPTAMNPSSLSARLRTAMRGEVSTTEADRTKYSRDTSIFVRIPEVVVYPKDPSDVVSMVKAVREAKQEGVLASITARSAGTDMSGGPLTTSVVAVFTKYMNKVIEVEDGFATVEPGTYYRDFEKATLEKGNQILPSYPASRELCALGGIVNNNSGGERTLEYGKTMDYIEEIEVILDDGTRALFRSLTPAEVEEKKLLLTREGEIYRDISKLLADHKEEIAAAKPKVSKNSAGYALWDVMDPITCNMNLAKLICGAQGTLALTTKFKLRLVKQQEHRAMLVVFLTDLSLLPEIVRRVLPFNPESFESYDDNTFKLAIKFLPQMLMQMGLVGAARLGFSFLPEVAMVLRGGVPTLVLMAEFSEDTAEQALFAANQARSALLPLGLTMSVKRNEREAEKYWKVRRESFALLRKNVHGLYAAPFIDDFVVPPDCYPEFLPKLDQLLNEYKDKFIYTIAGHIGNGNFHIIPLMDLAKAETRTVVLELAPRVYDLVIEYGGTTTGEHNDGIIRTPYLGQLFGDEMVKIFEQTKNIFDPLDIFNPGKKVHGTFADIERDMIRKLP